MDEIDFYVDKRGGIHYIDPLPDDDSDDFSDRVEETPVRTNSEQDSDDFRTTTERESDVVRRSSQTRNATDERESLPAITPRDFVELYGDVVSLINDRKFCKKVLGTRSPKYYFSLPKALQNAINDELDCNIRPATMNKIQICNLYCKRFSPATFWSVLVATIMLLGSVIYYLLPKEIKEVKSMANTSTIVTSKEQRAKDSSYITNWANKNNFQFTGYRYGLMLTNKNFVEGNDAERSRILQDHKEKQTVVMSK